MTDLKYDPKKTRDDNFFGAADYEEYVKLLRQYNSARPPSEAINQIGPGPWKKYHEDHLKKKRVHEEKKEEKAKINPLEEAEKLFWQLWTLANYSQEYLISMTPDNIVDLVWTRLHEIHSRFSSSLFFREDLPLPKEYESLAKKLALAVAEIVKKAQQKNPKLVEQNAAIAAIAREKKLKEQKLQDLERQKKEKEYSAEAGRLLSIATTTTFSMPQNEFLKLPITSYSVYEKMMQDSLKAKCKSPKNFDTEIWPKLRKNLAGVFEHARNVAAFINSTGLQMGEYKREGSSSSDEFKMEHIRILLPSDQVLSAFLKKAGLSTGTDRNGKSFMAIPLSSKILQGDQLSVLAFKIKQLKKQEKKEDKAELKEDDVPGQFLDPVMYTLMEDPVKFKGTNGEEIKSVYDRTTIVSHIEERLKYHQAYMERHGKKEEKITIDDPLTRIPIFAGTITRSTPLEQVLDAVELIPQKELQAQIAAYRKKQAPKGNKM